MIPSNNLLDKKAKQYFEAARASDAESHLRFLFATDRELMRKIMDAPAHFVWEEWVNKSLSYRNLRIFLNEDDTGEPDLVIAYAISSNDLHFIMVKLFPWATYTYANRDYSGEVMEHTLKVVLRPAARAFLETEAFFKQGVPDEEAPRPPEDPWAWNDDEENAFLMQRAIEKDPYG